MSLYYSRVPKDGVLLHGARALPAGRKALQILEGQNPLSRQVQVSSPRRTDHDADSEKERYHTYWFDLLKRCGLSSLMNLR